jgi:hypothetical protein
MSKAYINIEDNPDGTVSVNFVFEDELSQGFNSQSAAHNLCNAVRAEMDKIMVPAEENPEAPGALNG